VNVEWGEHAEFQLTDDGRGRIFVEQGSDWWQTRYQIAHEVFHGFFTRPQRFHWTHEMFAVEAALAAMRRIGEDDYVASVEWRLTGEAESLPLERMLTTPIGPSQYPEGLYGRAFVTGRALIDAIGWRSLKGLVHTVDAAGQPSVAAWLSTLDVPERRAAVEVLGRDSGLI